MHRSISAALTGLLAAIAVSAAPAPAPAPQVTVAPGLPLFGQYSTYESTHCTGLIAANQFLNFQACNGLPDANSINATFDDAQGAQFRLFYDSQCQDFATFLPLDTCVNTEEYFSVNLNCIGGVLCA